MSLPSGGGGLVLRRGSLRRLLRERTAAALRSGALQPIPTDFEYVEEGGVRFLVRILSALARKDEERWRREREARVKGREANPFLPYDRELFVCDLTDTHLGLLNKYNVVEEHLLVVTRRFEDQELYLDEEDFAALLLCLGEYGSLAFYNGGTVAGASQRHKHLQLVPLPLAPEGPAVPVEALVAAARYDGETGRSEGFPFLHAVARLDPRWVLEPTASAREALGLYHRLLVAAGMERKAPPGGARQSCPYNLLATRRWMLLVPRSREFFDGVSVNALGFAGALLVRDAEQARKLREKGPLEALRGVAFEASPPAR